MPSTKTPEGTVVRGAPAVGAWEKVLAVLPPPPDGPKTVARLSAYTRTSPSVQPPAPSPAPSVPASAGRTEQRVEVRYITPKKPPEPSLTPVVTAVATTTAAGLAALLLWSRLGVTTSVVWAVILCSLVAALAVVFFAGRWAWSEIRAVRTASTAVRDYDPTPIPVKRTRTVVVPADVPHAPTLTTAPVARSASDERAPVFTVEKIDGVKRDPLAHPAIVAARRGDYSKIPESVTAWARGAAAEEAVGNRLNALGEGWEVWHDPEVLKRGRVSANIDHLVTGPGVVYMVDTKNWTGTLRIEKGTFSAGRDHPGNEFRAKAPSTLAYEADQIKGAKVTGIIVAVVSGEVQGGELRLHHGGYEVIAMPAARVVKFLRGAAVDGKATVSLSHLAAKSRNLR